MKEILKEIIYGGKRILPSRGASVLMYHSIGNNQEFFTVKRDLFVRQLQYLTDCGCRVSALSSLVATPRTVVLTFDDGYEDNYTIVFPLLVRFQMPASIFLTTSYIGGIRTMRSGRTLSMLSWKQIREMRASGLVEFFPHTHTHPKLTDVPFDVARYEIRQSQNIIRKHLGSSGSFFAYPYGYYDRNVIEVVREAGFVGAVTIQSGIVTHKTNPFLIPRNSIDSRVTFSMFRGIIQRGRIR